MYVKEGTISELLFCSMLKRLYPRSIIVHNEKNDNECRIDLEFKIWSRKINIEVKSCKFRVKNSNKRNNYTYGKFMIYPNNLVNNDVFIFHVRDIDVYRIIPTSYLKMLYDDLIKNSNDKKKFSISCLSILKTRFFTMDYILKHYCNQPSCSFNCEICPFQSEASINQFNYLFERSDVIG